MQSEEGLYVLSLNRFLYILNSFAQKGTEPNLQHMKILNRIEFESNIRFALHEKLLGDDQDWEKSMISVSHDQEKTVTFFKLDEFLTQPVE